MLSSSTSLTKPQALDSCTIQLTSPMLHIGSEVQKLSPFEYVATSKFVYQPNAEVLARSLYQQGRLPDYLDTIKERRSILPILEQAFGEDWSQAQDASGQPIFPKVTRSLCWADSKQISDLRPMIRNGYRQLYIPGSSIKGAIRTAIAYHLLKNADQFQVPKQKRISAIELELQKSMGSLRQKAKFADDALFMDALFSDFRLEGDRSNVRTGPNTDFMRAIKVTDSEPLIEQKIPLPSRKNRFENLSITAEVLVSSRFGDYRAKYRASIYAELARNVQTTFTITLDHHLLNQMQHLEGTKIPFKSVGDILQICQAFAQDQWDAEHDYWQDVQNNPNQRDQNGNNRNLDTAAIRNFYEATTCPYALRLGWGSGMNGTTVGLLLDDQLRSQLRDTCGIRAPGFEAPKSRRTVVGSDGTIKFVPGWVKFKAL
ncbi:type III-A CRISPR-associated RAMP protein Csm5 [Phormidesmis priestleyi]|uniref:type III-A CRISPR-associated RAMP protein Csm5 n=1 Tax=Phormidesmis priestleyi TaxID=268141 RepID=UPI00083AF1EF|nr:type III-A CRISPR-associated RAMP protein Csm5 [Phormidesmis priestleyi]